MEAARRALARNGGSDWASASGAYRAKYLRAIAAKVLLNLEAYDCYLLIQVYDLNKN